ncbi:cyclin-J isoform X1 [Macrobrachium rosenbergii]|uniref:cyclin-J isoform X1 n=2 Tax=Macrobrachium rosenbergii TaxID=79674 RepID=UPI0034D44A9F
MLTRLYLKLQTLYLMMSRGSNVMTDYAEEVLAWMQRKELEHPSYNGNSPQLAMRNSLVEFIRVVSEHLKLNVPTTHLAVYLLDRFMDAHFISGQQLKLTALTAILLAAKFEERDTNVPRIPELNAFVKSKYTVTIFNSMEAFMLNFYNWNVGTVTAAHFAEFYLMQGITTGDTMNGVNITVPSQAIKILWKATMDFLDITLQDQAFLQWRSSLVAAACLACGRFYCHLLPTWPLSLEMTTGYHLQKLSHIMDLLIRIYEKEEKGSECSSSDSAYSSNCSSLQGSPVTQTTNE